MGNRVLSVDRVARIGSHVVIWAVVLVPTAMEMIRGWRPLVGDDATITLRAYQVLSLHPPLLGMQSGAHVPGHNSFHDLGPLQFVLLAIPVHIDHSQGSLWGSAILVAVMLSLAVESMWSGRRWFGCVLVSLAVADLAWAAPTVIGHEIWSPNFSMFFMLASIVLAVAVALGSFGWWPVLVFGASVTIQSQLFNGFVVTILVLVCPLIGLWHSGRPRRLRWLILGVGVGITCWLPTIIQQLFGSHGNLSAFFSARNQELFGLGVGMRNLGGIIWPIPLPVHPYDMYTSYLNLGSGPVAAGAVVLLVPAIIAVIAGRSGQKDLAALATVGFICSACVVVNFALVPRASFGPLSWLVPMLWIVAFLWWVILGWAFVVVIRVRFLSKSTTLTGLRPSLLSVAMLGGVFLVAAFLAVPAPSRVWPNLAVPSDDPANPQEGIDVGRAVKSIAHEMSRQTVTIKFWPSPPPDFSGSEGRVEWDYGQALLWQLTGDGFDPRMQSYFSDLSGVTYSHDPSAPTVNVVMTNDNEASRIRKVVIGAYHPPARLTLPLHVKLVIPKTGSAVHGSATLGALATGVDDVTKVDFVLSGGSLSNHEVVSGVRTPYGWIAIWHTTTVPNGTYEIQSVCVARGGFTATSPPISVTVANAGTSSPG